jgi:hypothetical protein
MGTDWEKIAGLRLLRLIRDKFHRNRIHTMSCVLRRETLTQKDMPQMCTAMRAGDFRTLAVRVRRPFDRARNFLVKARPATVGFKLVIRTVQLGAAASADVSSFFPEGEVLAGERGFRGFVDYDTLFFFRQRLGIKFILS